MIKLKFIVGILIIVLVSGCVNSNEPAQKTQPIISPTPIPTKEVKIINIDAQQIVLDENDIKEVLGTDWKASQDTSKTILQLTPRSRVSRTYESELIQNSRGGSIQYEVTIEIMVYGSIDEANRETSVVTTGGEKINIGDHGGMESGNGIIDIYFVKNNVVSRISFTRGMNYPDKLSETEKTEMISIDKAYSLAKKQDAKISRILEVIK